MISKNIEGENQSVQKEQTSLFSKIENSGNENRNFKQWRNHTSIDPNTATIAIIDDIINNKPYQIVVDRTPHNKFTWEDHEFENHEIKIVEINPNDSQNFIKLLEYHVNPLNETFLYVRT